MKLKPLLFIFLLLIAYSGIIFGSGNIVPLKDNLAKSDGYSSVLCFHISGIDKSNVHVKPLLIVKKEGDAEYTLKYFNGTKLCSVPVCFRFRWNPEDKTFYYSGIVYLAVKPGNYDFFGLAYDVRTMNSVKTYCYSINSQIEFTAGNAYYAGNLRFNIDENSKSTCSVFMNNVITDTITNDFEKKFPTTYSALKSNFSPAIITGVKPLQPTKEIFSSHFTKEEGIWKESNDSLHTTTFENGQFCMESKSKVNSGTEIIELPEKLGHSFEIELRTKWLSGVTRYSYGFIIPNKKPAEPGKVEIEPQGYIFGITANANGIIWFETIPLFSKKRTFELMGWSNIHTIKTMGKQQNVMRLQVAEGFISYFVNDLLVTRAPYNEASGLTDKTHFLHSGSKYLGIYSSGKQKIEFDSIKVSKLD